MASEILAIPEDDLEQFVGFLEYGLKHNPTVRKSLQQRLKKWCREERQYLRRLRE